MQGVLENLKNLEIREGFGESAYDYSAKKKLSFFNLGPENNWEKLLDVKIAKKIKEEFSREMLELGYL